MQQTFEYWSPDIRPDPYPLYHAMLEAGPAHHDGESWVVCSHADVLRVLTDPSMSSIRAALDYLPADERQAVWPLIELNQAMMLFSDPPSHGRLRGLVAQAFSAKMIEGMRPRIAGIVTELLADIEPGQEWDIIETIANPLPGLVICELLGVPAGDQPLLKRWSNDYAAWLGVTEDVAVVRERANISMAEMSAYIRDEVAQRRANLREDLLTGLVQAEEAGDRLSEQELVSTVLLLLFAGNETTTNLIGNGMLTLLRQRAAFEQLRADPSLIRTATEELLRYESPVQFTGRRVTQPFEVGGATIEPGQLVTILLGAANRDPEQFAEPDQLDLARRPNRHLSLAHGIHFCLGAPLARAEGQGAIGALVERFPNLELVSEDADWVANPLFRGLRSLRVVG